MIPQEHEEQSISAPEEALVPRACHNCGSPVTDRYCGHCGQEYSHRVLSMQHLAGEFVAEIFSYDSNLVRTLRCLFLRPGCLTTEYRAGRRASYIAPFRLYLLATVVLFFSLSFQYRGEDSENLSIGIENAGRSRVDIDTTSTDHGARWNKYLRSKQPVKEYDREQAALPAAERDGLIDHFMTRRTLVTVSLYNRLGPEAFQQEMQKRLFDNAPTGMFLILPLFALLLKLAYLRTGRLYIEHLVFALHIHAFLFMALAVSELIPISHWSLNLLILLGMGWYLLVAARVVYEQSTGSTLLKFALLAPFYFVLLALAAALVAVLTLVK